MKRLISSPNTFLSPFTFFFLSSALTTGLESINYNMMKLAGKCISLFLKERHIRVRSRFMCTSIASVIVYMVKGK